MSAHTIGFMNTPVRWTGLGAVQSIVASPGVMNVSIQQGDSIVVTLPTGSSWLAVPVAVGAAVSGAAVGTGNPATISGLRAGTVGSLSWTDSTGVPQTAALSISVSPPAPTAPTTTGTSTGTMVAIGVGVVAALGLLYWASRHRTVMRRT